MNLREKLIREKRTRWLDIGSGGIFDDDFYYADTFPDNFVQSEKRKRYFRINIIYSTPKELAPLGKFDFIRMQHVFEHFSFEEARTVLQNCSRLLKKGGALLITVPDLRTHINHYLKKDYKKWAVFKNWAENRVPPNSPDSFYFSMFAHSMPYEAHKWCYDFDGLQFQLKKSRRFKNIRELKLKNPLSGIPFTHNRPEEDLCMIAYRK